MEKIQSRFGEIEYDEANLLHFPAGLIGMPELRRFVVMPNKKASPLFWIQSIDDTDIALILTDPTNFFLDYSVTPSTSEKNALRLEEDDNCFVLTVVTVSPDQEITLNLVAPILFSPKSNRAIQVILENSPYHTKTPLPEVRQQPSTSDNDTTETTSVK